jgi:hypothetical protein
MTFNINIDAKLDAEDLDDAFLKLAHHFLSQSLDLEDGAGVQFQPGSTLRIGRTDNPDLWVNVVPKEGS